MKILNSYSLSKQFPGKLLPIEQSKLAFEIPGKIKIINVDIGDEMSTISATGKMGEYGNVYVTYNLTYATRTSGFVSGNGRGALDADNGAAGAFRGGWNREGSRIKIRQIF